MLVAPAMPERAEQSRRPLAVGLGAGGHARSVVDALLLDCRYEVMGPLDANPALTGRELLGLPILGDDRLLPSLRERGARHFFLGLGGTGGECRRRALFELGLQSGLEPVDVVHPKAVVSPFSRLGRGVVVLAGAVVNACARLGDGVLVNTGAIVEHDCGIGDHAHLATGARLAGMVGVGEGAHVGAGAVVREGVQIGAGALVAAGAVVVEDVPCGATVAGIPARPLERRR